MANPVLRSALLGAVLALLVNSLIFFVATTLGITLGLRAAQPGLPTEVTYTMIVIVTLLASLGALVVRWLLERNGQPVGLRFLAIGAAVTLLSMLPVFGAAVNRSVLLTLGLLHVGTALAIVYAALFSIRWQEPA